MLHMRHCCRCDLAVTTSHEASLRIKVQRVSFQSSQHSRQPTGSSQLHAELRLPGTGRATHLRHRSCRDAPPAQARIHLLAKCRDGGEEKGGRCEGSHVAILTVTVAIADQ